MRFPFDRYDDPFVNRVAQELAEEAYEDPSSVETFHHFAIGYLHQWQIGQDKGLGTPDDRPPSYRDAFDAWINDRCFEDELDRALARERRRPNYVEPPWVDPC